MLHADFELNPMQNDRAKVDFGSGPRESGPKVACHLNSIIDNIVHSVACTSKQCCEQDPGLDYSTQ